MNLNNLGLAQSARAIIIGEDNVLEKLRKNKIFLIILANDSGNTTLKKFRDKASFYKVNVNEDCTSDELSKAIGKNNVHVIGLMNRGFVKLLEK